MLSTSHRRRSEGGRQFPISSGRRRRKAKFIELLPYLVRTRRGLINGTMVPYEPFDMLQVDICDQAG